MVEKTKRWFEWLPGWIPICFTLVCAALWVGQYTQGINDSLSNLRDRLNIVEKQIQDIQDYLRTHRETGDMSDVPRIP